ncbi:MAG TPA: hypothetical protein VGK02_11050 [Candidatus Aquicultor sp.]|jgi:hypothetical protein
MSDVEGWANSQNDKLNRIQDLISEIMDNHNRMQELLNDAIIKCQAERGVRDIERYLTAGGK